jgi:hypothetical protein
MNGSAACLGYGDSYSGMSLYAKRTDGETLVVKFTRLSPPEVRISHCLLLHPRGTKCQILTTSGTYLFT